MTKSLSLIALAFAAAPLAGSLQAQTTSHAPVHHTTTAVHHTAASVACPIELPPISPKIPALPATAPKCPPIAFALQYVDITLGTGELAAPHKWYTVHYTGYLLDGTKFDSSLDRNEPITFPYGAGRVIKGWDTGFDGMRTGGKRRLFVPYELAYGEAGRPPVIPAKAMLIFDVEFISQSDNQPAPPAPKPITAPTAPPAASAPASAPAKLPTPPAGTTAPATVPATPPAPKA